MLLSDIKDATVKYDALMKSLALLEEWRTLRYDGCSTCRAIDYGSVKLPALPFQNYELEVALVSAIVKHIQGAVRDKLAELLSLGAALDDGTKERLDAAGVLETIPGRKKPTR